MNLCQVSVDMHILKFACLIHKSVCMMLCVYMQKKYLYLLSVCRTKVLMNKVLQFFRKSIYKQNQFVKLGWYNPRGVYLCEIVYFKLTDNIRSTLMIFKCFLCGLGFVFCFFFLVSQKCFGRGLLYICTLTCAVRRQIHSLQLRLDIMRVLDTRLQKMSYNF